jgi:hypothetical protein
MNRNSIIIETSPTLQLDADPLALRLPVGASIFAVYGAVWITQERLRDDIVLAAGQRFDVERGELILASSVKGTAAIHIVQPAVARAYAHPDLHEFARARAQHLRRAEIARLAGLVVSAMSAGITRMRTALAPRPRAMSH